MSVDRTPAKGWVLLWRGYWDSPDFKPEPFSEREAFLWSVTAAAHAPHIQWFNGVPIPVARGEFATSSRKLAAVFRWSEKRARGFMQRMSKRGNWTLRTAQEGTHLCQILTVCNYERFQAAAKAKDAPEDAPEDAAGTHPGRTEDAQQNNSNNSNNDNEGKEGSRALVPLLPYAEAVAAWTQIAAIKGWTPVRPVMPLSGKRRTQLGKLLKAHGIGGWIAGLQRAADSEMLGGPDPPNWFNFQFAINPENFLKIVEGNYDRSFNKSAGKQRQSSGWLAACADLTR